MGWTTNHPQRPFGLRAVGGAVRLWRAGRLGLLAAACLGIAGCGGSADAPEDPREMKVLVIGMDGLDPELTKRLLDEGRLPNFARLIARGVFSPLETSMPPQSPVAWSNFISGATPATHNVWDFIHRQTTPFVAPVASAGKAVESEKKDWNPEFGRWQIPVFGGSVENLRRGPAFWESLVIGGVDTTIYRVPAAYPPPPKVKGQGEFRCLCGMGTPDLTGGYGEFACYKEDERNEKRTVAGGTFYRLDMVDHRGAGKLYSIPNFLRRARDNDPIPTMERSFELIRDPEQPSVQIRMGDANVILRQGEWSDWIPVTFDTGIPGSTLISAAGIPTSANAMVRMYLKQAHPKIWLYVSPLNIDPTSPFNAISTPTDFAAEIAAGSGRYYTTGIPEDTKALRADALTEDEFLSMVRVLVEERTAQYRQALADFKRGFLFFYFGHTDQLAHVFWRDIDPGHPGRKPEQDGKYDKVIESTYLEMDERVGEALRIIDDNDVLIVMSDHGFASFRRGFNVNTWLIQNGYQRARSDDRRKRALGLAGGNVDWPSTRAYAVGINALYINVSGREAGGIVPDSERSALAHEIGDKLLQIRDEDGSRVIEKVYYTFEEYPGADPMVAPDMLIGYARNYRGSWATSLGGQPFELLEDNLDRWSGDHCIAHYLVPGTLAANRPITVQDPALIDLAPSILQLFNLKPPEAMIGRPIFGPR